MGLLDKKDTRKIKSKKSRKDSVQPSGVSPVYSDDKVKTWFGKRMSDLFSDICCMIYGVDGTGKTGIAISYFEPLLLENKKLVIIDLDGGAWPIVKAHHKKAYEAGNIIIINPMVTTEGEDGTEIDYKKTFAKIRAIIRYTKRNYEKDNIAGIIFDGLSTLLRYAEYQMRIEKGLDADGTVSWRYWMPRNKLFLETLVYIKSIPIARFFIAHDDFIKEDQDPKKKFASVRRDTNSMMFQKIKCKRADKKGKVIFRATIDKVKYNNTAEGKSFKFLVVDNDKAAWGTVKLFNALDQDEKI